MSEAICKSRSVDGKRRCAKCREWHPEESFRLQTSGYRLSFCPPCQFNRMKAHRETPKAKESLRKWQAEYFKTDGCKEAWRRNAARVRASKKGRDRIAEYYANPEIKKSKSEYHAIRNQTERAKEQRRKNQEKYRKTPKGMAVMRAHAYRRKIAKLKTVVGDFRAIERWHVSWMLKPKVACYWCRGSFAPEECHADHIQPLVDGGHHAIGNLCISCGPCNLRKHSKNLADWNKKLREPVLL